MEQLQNLETIVEATPKPAKRSKIKEWLYRYGPAEVICTATAYAGYFIAKKITDNDIVAAYAATLGDTIGFYGTMLAREVFADKKKAEKKGKNYGAKAALKTTGKIVTEFGISEVLDSLVVRPAMMGLGVKFLGQGAGILAGKMAANITFYAPAIISYEIRKYITAKNTPNPQ